MAYRGASRCEFCDEPPAASCPRCACATCFAHSGAQWCAGCAKELGDALDVARFAAQSAEPSGDRPNLLAFAFYAIETWWWWSGYEERKIRRRFTSKTREEILAWRRGSGVPVRS